ncbi:MAG: RtcB family protein [Alkalispirochaetaceae bacterium]
MRPDSLERINETLWELPTSYKQEMQVPARIYGTEELINGMDEGVYDQAANVAALPGIVGYSFCMPDGHWGYGFPIGGAAAFDPEVGIISPGGIGFDINCGMRLIRTDLTLDEVGPKLETLVDRLFKRIPAGVGGSGMITLSKDEFRELITRGMEWSLDRGYATAEDLSLTEERGRMAGADASKVSEKAISRGYKQVGTLGSGNHYLEVQVAREQDVVDPELARRLGIDRPNQVLLMLHTGSRGFGHQVATDYLQRFLKVMNDTYHLGIRDRELACAPFSSPEGQEYFAAMQCGVNMAFCNRQMILHGIREVFSDVFGKSADELGIRQVYDVTHNTAKLERHRVEGEERELLVHRKGATRAFAPGMREIPEVYKDIGQPVIIGGSMETGSYLLLGRPEGEATFFTTAHGSGRIMGRRQAKREFRGDDLKEGLRRRGIYVRAVSNSGLAEEAGGAYKSIDAVVDAADRAGLSRKVVRLTPVGNIKG